MRLFKNLFKKEETKIEDVTETVESVDVNEEIVPSEINEDGEFTNTSEIAEMIDNVQDSIDEKINLEFAITELKEQITNLVSKIEEKDLLVLDLENRFSVLDSEYKSTLEKLATVEKSNDEKIAMEAAKIVTSHGFNHEALPEIPMGEPESLLQKSRKLKGEEFRAFYQKNKEKIFEEIKKEQK